MFVMMCIKWNWKQQHIFWKKDFHVTNLEFSISECYTILPKMRKINMFSKIRKRLNSPYSHHLETNISNLMYFLPPQSFHTHFFFSFFKGEDFHSEKQLTLPASVGQDLTLTPQLNGLLQVTFKSTKQG